MLTGAYTFDLAAKPGDYKKCKELMRQALPEVDWAETLSFPTIRAFEGEELVGIFATQYFKQRIIAGPLALRPDKKRLKLLLTMVDVYDATMQALGITDYLFHVRGDNQKFLHLVEKIGFQPIETNINGTKWFKRTRIEANGRQS